MRIFTRLGYEASVASLRCLQGTYDSCDWHLLVSQVENKPQCARSRSHRAGKEGNWGRIRLLVFVSRFVSVSDYGRCKNGDGGLGFKGHTLTRSLLGEWSLVSLLWSLKLSY
ncbi:hypothetical protein TcWFU_003433 [Taenia crassiceps]|uniref:Uncharacterized protein n=1 Tax=Taenia crassiceps TaxID=6207 RepID=A0ABR4QKD6_9CEST